MIGFALDVAAVVVGIAVYGRIRKWLHERRYYTDYDTDPWWDW
jgi:hypothetical protein